MATGVGMRVNIRLSTDVQTTTSLGRFAGDLRSDTPVPQISAPGFPVVDLDDYDGRTVDALKVGTVKRAKGLEFKQVPVAMVDQSLLDAPAADATDVARERLALDRRELYVAMTRARDGLWVGVAS